MRKKYLRSSLSVEAEKYEPGKNMEDGFEPWTKVVTAGWIVTEGLVNWNVKMVSLYAHLSKTAVV